MSEFVIPPWIVPDEENIELIDDNTVAFEPALGRGISQRQSFGSPRFRISRKHTVRQGEEAHLASILSLISGKLISVRSTIKKTLRGSFATSELISNNQFTSGTSGWSALNNSIHRVSDSVSTVLVGGAQTGSAGVDVFISRSVTTVQYAAYSLRGAFTEHKNVPSLGLSAGSSSGVGDYFSDSGSLPTMLCAAGIVNATTTHCNFGFSTASGNSYQDLFRLNYTSLSRCALVDNDGNNLLQSDTLSTTWTQSAVTISADVIASPFIGETADGIVETVANTQHQLSQSYVTTSDAFDVCFTAYVKPGIRNFVFLRLDDGAGNGYRVSFNLTTAAIVTSTGFGTGFTNLRTFSEQAGNGWLLLSIVARKATAATAIACRLEMTTDGTTLSYAGSTAGPAVYAFRNTSTLSSFPTRPSLTTSSQAAATAQTGSALYIKGLPASTSGLALPGDFVEINGELKKLTAPLDSDGLGLGYLQFKPEMVRSPTDNDPIHFFQPMGRFLVSNVRTRQRVSDVELTYDLEQIYE